MRWSSQERITNALELKRRITNALCSDGAFRMRWVRRRPAPVSGSEAPITSAGNRATHPDGAPRARRSDTYGIGRAEYER